MNERIRTRRWKQRNVDSRVAHTDQSRADAWLDPQSSKSCILGVGMVLLCTAAGLGLYFLASQLEVDIQNERKEREAREMLRKLPPEFKCNVNLSVMGEQLVQYARANSGRLPEDDGTGGGWVRVLEERSTSRGVAASCKCPADHSAAATSYVLNANLVGKSILDFTDRQKAHIILLREIDGDGHRLAYYLDGSVKEADGGADELTVPTAAAPDHRKPVSKNNRS